MHRSLSPGRRAHGERGATLMLALAFLLLFSVVVAAVLVQTQTGLKTTSAVTSHDDKLYAADGGIDYGIQKVRTTASLCPDVASGQQSVGTIDLNGRTVTVTCKTLSGDNGAGGSVFGPSGWTTVATGYGTAAWSSTKARCNSPSTPTDLGSTIQVVNCTGATGPTRTVTDAVLTQGKNTLTSASAAFTAADKGASLSGAGIPAGTTINRVNSATSVNMSQNATASGTNVSVVIGGKPVVTFGGTKVFNAGGFNIATNVTGQIQGSIVQYDDHGYCTRDQAAAHYPTPNDANPTVGGSWNCTQPGTTPVPDPKPHVVVPPDPASRTITDAMMIDKKNTLTSATGNFTTGDVGATLTGAGIPTGTTVKSVTDATTLVMSKNATTPPATASVTITQTGAHAKVTQACGGINVNYLYPGQYLGSAPQWGGYTYMASGVYYISNTGETAISGNALFGGEPGANDARFVPVPGSDSNCFTDAAADAACGGCLPADPGKGVTFILGGSTLLDIHGGTTELFSRVPGTMDAGATPNTTVFAMANPAGLGQMSGGTYQLSATAGADRCNCAFVTDNSGQQIIFHGLTYSPYSPVDVYNNAGIAYSPFYGGVVANWIVARVDAGSQAGLFTGQFNAAGGPTKRTIVIKAVAPGTASGETPITSTAVIEVDVDSGKTTTVDSWRNQ